MKLRKLRRSIKAHEEIRAFNRKNQKTKFSTQKVQVLKVYDRKKKKYIGTFNETNEKGKLIPKYFGRVQFRMYNLLKAPQFSPPIGRGISFSVDPKNYVKFQVPTRIVRHVMEHAIRRRHSFQVQIQIKTIGGQVETHTRNPAYLLTKGNTVDDIRKIITNEAICAAVTNNLRFSLVVHARPSNKIKRQIKSARIQITYNKPPMELSNAKKGRNNRSTRKIRAAIRGNKKNKKAITRHKSRSK